MTRDDRGVITESTDGAASFSATYDNSRRLKTVTYDGQATVTYTYDARNLLTRVEDDLSGVWMTFTYDNDGRMIRVQRSSGVSTTYTYDNAGRLVGIEDGPLANQNYTLNAEGDPTEAMMDVPLGAGMIRYTYDRAGRLTGADYGEDNQLALVYDAAGNLLSRSGSTPLAPALIADNYTYDAACQVNSAGYEFDARGRQTAASGKVFGYNGASRLTSVTADGSTASFTYNGLGDLRSRTAGGMTTHYYHNYALGLDPIVAEKAGASYKRFYIYTPAGALLYSIDPATHQVRFYHYDRVGSTLFLTDGTGAVSDAYAYDPYGNVLGHTGSSDQPFTFIGRYGVRYEPVGGLYDMRIRVYDPATARFLTRDPVWPVLRDPRSLNPYAYAAQNPLRYVDPLGLRWIYALPGERGAPNRPGGYIGERVGRWTWVGTMWRRWVGPRPAIVIVVAVAGPGPGVGPGPWVGGGPGAGGGAGPGPGLGGRQAVTKALQQIGRQTRTNLAGARPSTTGGLRSILVEPETSLFMVGPEDVAGPPPP